MNSSHLSEQEITRQLLEAHSFIVSTYQTDKNRQFLRQAWPFFDLFYQPDDTLRDRLKDYVDWCENRRDKNPWHLMEEIAYLAFRCLAGEDSSISSGQSESSQHDLVVTSSSLFWNELISMLHLPANARKILVEAKNTAKPVDDAQFARVCHILETKLSEQCYLGVFFTRKGATGFPKRGSKQQRALKDARATQTWFHARTKKYVIVLDESHILRLGEPGSLPRILEALIRDVEDRFGKPVDFDEDWKESNVLPPHLKKYVSNSVEQSDELVK